MTFAEKALKALEDAMMGNIGKPSSISINGKSISQMSLSEQFELRQKLLQEIAAQKRNESGNSPIGSIRVLF